MIFDGSQPPSLLDLRPILDTALDAVVVIGGDGIVLAWNGAAERTFGWTAAEAVGATMAELIVPAQHRQAHGRGMVRYLETGEERVLNRTIEITALRRDGEEFPVELSIARAPSETENIFIGFLRDISLRRRSEERIRRQAREAELLFQVTKLAAETDSFDEALHACLRAICDLTGWPVGHALVTAPGREDELVSTSVWHEHDQDAAASLRASTKDVRFMTGIGLPGAILATGEPVWMTDVDTDPTFIRDGSGFGAAFGFPVKSEGKTIAALEFFARTAAQPDPDLMLTVRTLGEQVGRVIERKRTEQHQRLLVGELNHRVKNMLAIVQAVASQTFKGEAGPARAAFDARLSALAAAHDVLTEEDWEAASLREVVEKTGLGCGADPQRVRVEGPEVRLQPRTAVSLGMALHELCTNAVKYGALSNEAGTVAVSWELSGAIGAPRLALRWEEQGGPPVAPPGQRGFGSRMIERALAAELGGTVKLEFPPEGARCTMEAPLPAAPHKSGAEG